ncbi:hypothetical protein [Hymenobacter chitinivorans]|uniref:Lipoprotein n=1 Tax=Hymenobacter chitinivorans DSM 11115 TaxID=1121954 RepID=A0A2M9BTF5_9BACT|nr:hypothetical protein [Hymenobacter chitinivorans]PJJ61226.1 hypothetical protein CLV45_2664 [Hymenobacter chitinivorans DSM 11115]
MKHLPKLPLLTLLFGILLASCAKENLRGDQALPASQATNGDIVCNNCLDKPLDLIKREDRTGKPVVLGTVEVCATADGLCCRFAAAGGKLTSTKIGLFTSEADMIANYSNPSPTKFYATEHQSTATAEMCIPLADIAAFFPDVPLNGQTLYMTAEAQITGSSGTVGGQSWAGNLTLNGKYPFDRYFTFTFRCDGPPPTSSCLFTQGYWFAKPNVVWPGCTPDNYASCGSVNMGGQSYSRDEARAIFSSSNKNGKTDAKQAFLQGTALQLSLDNNPSLAAILGAMQPGDECYGALAALARINTYFTGKAKQDATSLNNDRTKDATHTQLRADAELISRCLNTHSQICDANAVPL